MVPCERSCHKAYTCATDTDADTRAMTLAPRTYRPGSLKICRIAIGK